MCRRSPTGHWLALIALTLSFVTAPAAALAAPPVVDDAFLPAPGPASPLESTSQREPCTQAISSPEAAPLAARALGFTEVWPLSRGDGQLVAVIDTGVTPHPRLRDVIPGGDYVSTGDGLADCDAHGTFVAGIIAAQPSETDEFTGVAPAARILSIRQSSHKFVRAASTADDYQSENSYGNIRTLALAVRRAADLGATVINISEVGCVPADSVLDDRALGAALKYAVETKDAVVVAAAGNVGTSCREQNPPPSPLTDGRPDWDNLHTVATPAWYSDYVLTVGAVGPDGHPAEFSLAGPWIDVAAPGTGVVSLDPEPGSQGLATAIATAHGPAPIAGTSYAAPYVSGTVALVRSRFPELTAREVMNRIVRTAHPPAHGWDPSVGHGVIDPVAAVTADLDPRGEAGSRGFATAPEKVSGPPGRPPISVAAPQSEGVADPLPRLIATVVALACVTGTTVLLLSRNRRGHPRSGFIER